MKKTTLQVTGVCCVGMLLSSEVDADSFTLLGDLPGGDFFSLAHGVSDDGSVVVGYSSVERTSEFSEVEAFRWTVDTGMTGLGDLPGGLFVSRALGVSADGSVVVGQSQGAAGDEAFRWTIDTGMVGLGDLPGGIFYSSGTGVSADGTVVVGETNVMLGGGPGGAPDGDVAFRWTSNTGMVSLYDLDSSSPTHNVAAAVSADGSVVAGSGRSGPYFEAFRWTAETGMVWLGDIPGGTFGSAALGMSADGRVLVGVGESASGREAFRWTNADGMVGLGDLPGGRFSSRATGVAADGSVVVGISEGFSRGHEAFVWTEANGIQSLRELLISKGVPCLADLELTSAHISADGQWIVGESISTSGIREAYLANISALAIDTDGDGVVNSSDGDDDNDGVPDEFDDYPIGRFIDVRPASHWAFYFIETLSRAGITAGCREDTYCPEETMTRAQVAVFLERGIHGSDYSPPAPTGNVFNDVSVNHWAGAFIEQFFRDAITAGCGDRNYCPDREVTRDQLAIFLLRAKHGSEYSPPSAVGLFGDVPLSHWAVDWIEQLAVEGITIGCGNGNYCPEAPVTRAQMAVFLVRTFGL